MSQYQKGQSLYVIRSGMPELINKPVTVVADSDGPAVTVTVVGDWTFPHGETTASIQGSYLSSAPKGI